MRGGGKSKEIGGQSVEKGERKVEVKKIKEKSVGGKVTEIVRAVVTKNAYRARGSGPIRSC
jgi:hypothetical protein